MHASRRLKVATAVVVLAACGSGRRGVECIAPANPGGGWDLTCRAVAAVMTRLALAPSVRVTNMPGAGGGVAFAHTVTQRASDAGVLVAASPATTLRLAQHQYERFSDQDVRWLAAVGAEYGVLAVSPGAPWTDLETLMAAWRAHPTGIVVGGGSAVAGQDHMKVLLLARSAGLDPKAVRYVAFNGGGEALTSLLGGFIQVFSGDASEIAGQLEAGNVRALAVIGPKRLGGRLADVPTAKEQGFDVEWATWRGFYVPRGISDAEYAHWVDVMRQLAASDAWAEARRADGLEQFTLVGPEFQAFVDREITRFRELSRSIGLVP